MLNKCITVFKSLSIALSILFLLLVAFYVLATRIALHYLPDYKQEIVQLLNETSQLSIDLSSISSSWDGFDPVLHIHGLSVESKDHLYIDNVSFYFSFTQSLLALQPKFDRILIERSNLRVKQEGDGHWQILGFSSKDFNAQKDTEISIKHYDLNLFALFDGSTLNIKDLNAVIHNEKDQLRNLRLPTLNVNYSDGLLFASGQVLQKKGDKSLLNFSLKGWGPLSTEKLKGVLYVEARSSEFFGEFLEVYDWKKLSIQDIEGSSRAWINFDGLNITSVYGDLQVSELNWRSDEKSLAPIHNLAFSYLLQATESSTSLVIDNFAFEWSGMQCKPTAIDIKVKSNHINILADRLNVKCMNDIALAMAVLPEGLHKRLAISEPSGYLNSIKISIPKRSDLDLSKSSIQADILTDSLASESIKEKEGQHEKLFTFEAMLEGININAYESTPSGKNLNGYVYADDRTGYVSFLSDDFELGFPSLFIDTWEIKRAEGHVSWVLNDNEIAIFSDGLRLRRDDNSLIYGDFTLNLYSDEQHEDTLSLAIGMQDILFQDAVKFVPYYVVSHDLYSWLSDSLVAGTVNSGIYYGYGSVESTSVDNSFTSSLYLSSDNGIIQFDPDWPYLEELHADVIVQNGQLDIHATQAVIAGTTLENIEVFLPETPSNKTNYLNITSKASLSSKLINYWLSESPISHGTSHIAEQLGLDTSAEIDLLLKVPVTEAEGSTEKAELEYTVNTTITDGKVTHKTSNLTFDAVTGTFSVDSRKGLNAKNVKVKLLGENADLDIHSSYHHDKAKKPEQLTKLILKGKLGASSLFDYFDSAKPIALEGVVPYQAELVLSSEDKKYPLLNITSSLNGLACRCPAPFYKTPDSRETLAVSILLKPEQTYLDASLKSKRLPDIDAELFFANDKVQFGEILIGGAKLKNTDSQGINIAAKLKLANLENWVDFLSDTLSTQAPKQQIQEDLPLKQVQLEIQDLDGFGHLFQKTNILIKPDANRWLLDIVGRDIKGKVYLPKSDDDLILDFESLNLVSLDKLLNVNTAKDDRASKNIDPRKIPNLSFTSKKLMLENRPIGAWKFNIASDDSGIVFRNVMGNIKESKVTGQLNWRYTPQAQSTIALLDMVGNDIATIFEAFDFPVLLSSEKYSSNFALHWPDAPMEFALKSLSGNASISLEDGFLKTEDQKTGILRLFGVLNTESIKRRLKLDFSDLYKSGVGYDTLIAKVAVDQGLMTLSEPLVIDGPSGTYVLNGRSDLASKALDIDMLVELPFSQNVPLAALVLGAPQIGGLVWIADKLLGEPLSALTTSRYDITGTWEQPTVNLKQAMNASKKDRSKEKGIRDLGRKK